MSSVSHFFIFVLIFIPLQRCNARHIKVNDKGFIGQLRGFSIKSLNAIEEVMRATCDSTQRKGDSKYDKTKDSRDDKGVLIKTQKVIFQTMKYKKGLMSGFARIKSRLLFSWHATPSNIHKIKVNDNSEFYSDYSRPRTRPPSHN